VWGKACFDQRRSKKKKKKTKKGEAKIYSKIEKLADGEGTTSDRKGANTRKER